MHLDAEFDHVAHAAPSIRSLLPLYQDVLGGRFIHGTDDVATGYRAIHLAYADGTKIELLEPLDGSDFLDGFLRRHPSGGLHHVTFRVSDVRAAVDAARRAGYEVIGLNYERLGWQEAFLHPRSGHGVLVQFAQVAPDWPPPLPPDTGLDTILGPATGEAPHPAWRSVDH